MTNLWDIIVWVAGGAIVGWLASVVTGRNRRMGCLANVIVGVLGAIIGGFIAGVFGQAGLSGFNLRSAGVALLGAVILLVITGWYRGRRRR